MHPSVIGVFEAGILSHDEIAGRQILEVGSFDVNGSVRPIIEAHGPASYLGVDGGPGPRVDKVVDCCDLVDTFGPDSFDVVVTTEMLEHVRDWQTCIRNLCEVLRPGGLLVITTRSAGFPYHPHPEDHWRYSVEGFREILRRVGFDELDLYPDPDTQLPGIIGKARKPKTWAWPDEADVLAGIDGVTPIERPLTILGYPHQADGSGYYRFWLPYKHLARGTQHRVLLPEPGSKFTPDDDQIAEIDMVAGQRFMGPDGVMLWDRWKDKTLLVYETDDDMLRPDTSAGLAHLHDLQVQESFKHCLRGSDMVTVSTHPLAEQVRTYNPNVTVLPNHVDADLLYVDRAQPTKVTVGWAGGMSHLIDWVSVSDPISAVLDANPQIDMHFCGIDYSPLLKRICRYTPWKPNVWDYYKAIDFDIGVAPLADTPFNVCKSHIRALEYMALGIPVIASDVPAYNDLVVDGVTGFLVATAVEWAVRLTDLINDEAMRTEMGAKGREVAAGWTMQQGWKLWRDAYETVGGWS
jgi:glycosyltransferase involved in cell wall biosynthesis